MNGSLLLFPPKVQERNHLICGIWMLWVGNFPNDAKEILIEGIIFSMVNFMRSE